MNRFFKLEYSDYENLRKKMDTESGYPNDKADTWFCSADDAIKDKDGYCLIAAIPEISNKFTEAGAIEISNNDYFSILNGL